MPKKIKKYEDVKAYVDDAGAVALFDADACLEAWIADRELHKKVGVSRQAMHAYTTGQYAPKADRIPLFLEHAPESVCIVGEI
jgi:uncharacterized protein YigE (DUF2233 family)